MADAPAASDLPRYETLFRLARGGMATVHVGTARGALGFRQIVAIKKPHAHLMDAAFRKAFVTEARLASLLHHANVVEVRDIEVKEDEVSLIMTYVEGASLGELLQIGSMGGPAFLPAIAVRVVLDACAGLHAAHELSDERGRPLHLVHRDISPQNLLVGRDGVTRLADFGIAKFKGGTQSTSAGTLKGKVAYMAPEYLLGEPIDRRFDVFAMGTVFWEALTARRLFRAETEVDTVDRVLHYAPPSVSTFSPELGSAFDDVLHAALAKKPAERFNSAAAFAAALEASARSAGLIAGHRDVADLVESAVGKQLEERRLVIREKMANEPSVTSVSFDLAGVPGVESEDLKSTAKANPLPNSSMATPIPLVAGKSKGEASVSGDVSVTAHGRPTVPADVRPTLPTDIGTTAPVVVAPKASSSGEVPRVPPPQVTQPLLPPVSETTPRKPRAPAMTPATLRSEAPYLPNRKRSVAPPSNAPQGAPIVATRSDPTELVTGMKRRARPWPYLVAIMLGALVGIGVAVFVWKNGAPTQKVPRASSH